MQDNPFLQQSFVTDGTTFVNPVGLVFTIAAGLAIILLPRRYALIPVIALMCYMTMGMRVLIGGMNFTMMRILLPFGYARLILRGELRPLRMNGIDKMLLCFVIASVTTFTLLWQDYNSFKYKLGFAYSTLGYYFLFRFLIRNLDDIRLVIKAFALMMIPLVALMGFERFTGHNPFAFFGGVQPITLVRNGALRCEGPFAHPILAGTFAASLLPLFVGLRQKRSKWIAVIGVITSCTIIVLARSSGPLLAAMAGVAAVCLWRMRRRLFILRWGAVTLICGLALAMNAPVWFIIAKFDVFSGSTGWHRADLLNQAFIHLSDWWLIGTKSTTSWEEGLFDITNQYIVYGVDGGLITMFLFIGIIALCFQRVGRSVHSLESASKQTGFFVWTFGAALFGHAINFVGVSYFDQNAVNFWLLLAMISTLRVSWRTQDVTGRAIAEHDSSSKGTHGISDTLAPPVRITS